VDVASLEPYVTKETCRIMPELKIRAVIDLPVAMTRTTMGVYGVVAVAGGPLMTAVREVIDLAKLLEVARNSGALTALLGCGLGPLAARGARRFAVKKMVREAGLCIFRDRSSAELAKAFGRNGVTKASVDPAFLWTALRQNGERKSAGRITIALALRDWQMDAYAADLPRSAAQELKTRFEIELLRLVDTLRESGEVEIIPICMHTLALGGDDRMFYRRLFKGRPGLAASIPWRRRSPQDELEQMRCADVVVAMRYHACVFALAMQKLFLALDYTRGGKIAGLMCDTQNHDRMIDLARFDGRQAAIRLLADIEIRKRPNPPAVAEGERIYREGLRWLAKGISAAPYESVSTAAK
jgi:polysaccharide pyruvyl transferase WcaK-like protein